MDGMSGPSRSLGRRIRDQLWFSVIAILVLFLVLRVLGVRSTMSSFFLSVVLTIGLNVGLSYFYEHRARRGKTPRADPRGGDIRWREEPPGDDRYDDRRYEDRYERRYDESRYSESRRYDEPRRYDRRDDHDRDDRRYDPSPRDFREYDAREQYRPAEGSRPVDDRDWRDRRG